MKMIALIIMVAIVLEAIVEYVKTVMKIVKDKDYKTAITQGITIALGIAFAFIFNLQLFNGALSEFYEGLSINPVIDMILTGILFSRGANYFSDLVTRLTKKDDGFDLFVDDVEPQTDEDDEWEDKKMIQEVIGKPSNEKASE